VCRIVGRILSEYVLSFRIRYAMYPPPCYHLLYSIVLVDYYSESRTPPVNDTRSILLEIARCDLQKVSSVQVDPNLMRMAGDAETDKEFVCKLTAQSACIT
jgi:hypothetical protein